MSEGLEYQQSPVSRAIWPWPASPGGAAAKRASHSGPRATVQAVIGYGVAALFFFCAHRAVMAYAVGVIATVVLISGWLVPPVFGAIERFGKWLGRVLGVAVTWLLLVPFFYICFTAGRIGLLIRGKDPMERKFPAGNATCWVKQPASPGPESYRKQYQ